VLAKARSVAVIGMDAHLVEVEVQVGAGLPSFTVVGLPDTQILQARERVRAAIESTGEKWPQRRIVVNLSPAHLPKHGSWFDLAMALAVLCAMERVPQPRLESLCAVGELSLDGAVRRVRGALAAAVAAEKEGLSALLVPRSNAAEATLVGGVDVVPIDTLRDAVGWLRGRQVIDPAQPGTNAQPEPEDIDMTDVRGQFNAKQALVIAAAGGHNVLFSGPPGGGKTMLARRLPSILPALERDEALEVTRLYSVAGLLPDRGGLITRRPFRAPHHSVSTPGLVGGGSGIASPGEVSLAHRGVLFLDEASEFRRDALQALRGPLEDGHVTIVRSRLSVTYPSRFQLVLATNPCPCGRGDDSDQVCECPPGRLTAYKDRLSGPILDRVDLQTQVPRVTRADIIAIGPGEPSKIIRERVVLARERQKRRLAGFGFVTNAEIPPSLLVRACRLEPDAARYAEQTIDENRLSMRTGHRIIRVARTIADLEGASKLRLSHVAEAFGYRIQRLQQPVVQAS
jgi:magnesium chelatase family protein